MKSEKHVQADIEPNIVFGLHGPGQRVLQK